MHTVLIVDDEEAIRSSLGFALEDDYKILTASEPQSVFSILAQHNVTVVLLDLKLGAYDGMALLRKIRREFRPVAVIIMTAYGNVQTTVEAIKEGAYYYLTKPINIEELKILLGKALEYSDMRAEITYLSKEVRQKYNIGNIIGKSEPMKQIFELIDKVKDIDSNVLISGESGTGKELVAKAIHFFGKRAKEHFEVVNCAAIPSNLLESELFGYVKGAFTGAVSRKVGKFELADGGTIFLDEIGEMDYRLQSKLLRVLQSKEITPLGSNEHKKIDVRIIAATNKNLEYEIDKATFREDLYYRLNVIPIRMPPLRERREDIPPLIERFLSQYSAALGTAIKEIEPAALEALESYEYKGNVRELENIIERAVALSSDVRITIADLPPQIRESGSKGLALKNLIPVYIGESLKQVEARVISKTLETNEGNRRKTARILGISERGLQYKIKQYKPSH
ncbi:MAG: sigma-54-dependent Fis family transcriptional regulator [Deltaproteobacteria bacterium]|nr:sigma-54-dependent Fis family transcriptional regulator [Deltaproteobacteria bacterium]